jgi:hypothetical protein
MKSVLFLFVLVFPFLLSANTFQPFNKNPTAEKKHDQLLKFIEAKQYVLEANSLYDRYGRIAFVNPISNFFVVSDDEAVVQIGFNNGTLGFNGLGGVTLEGKLTKYEVKDRGVGKGFHIKMHFFGNQSATILMEVNDNGKALIHYKGMAGEALRLKGELLDIEESTIFFGSTSF